MSGIRRIICLQMECGSFNQIALFCAAGLCMSLTLVLGYDLQMAGQWF
jgi:hypothetical protein